MTDSVADYSVVSPIGEGAHGRFFLATPPARLALNVEHVVLKVVPGGDDAAFRRFTRELRLFNRVQHPHLVRLYDAGQHEDQFFYSMEWCAGGTLAAPAASLDRTGVVIAMGQIARAVDALHEQGIVHRDVRPSNVLLRAHEAGTDACLSDLGLAQLGSGSVTSMAPLASIGFMDPAQLLGDPAGRATDIYSLGATLHWALTGYHLHPIGDSADAMLAVRTVLRQPAQLHRDGLSADEADLIAACTERDPARRPATAMEVATVLDTFIHEAP